MKFHPDRHQAKGKEKVKEMNERFKSIKKAFDWLALNVDKYGHHKPY
jgi:DnaJ-class molecular chaperone